VETIYGSIRYWRLVITTVLNKHTEQLYLLSKLTYPFLVAIALLISPKTHAQESDYSISTYEEEGFLATNTHYLGEARLHFSMPADSLTGYGITKVLFKANSTLNWYKHGSTQVLIINKVGYCREGGKNLFS